MTTPLDQLPEFVWIAAGGLIVVRATASTYRYVVRQWVLARRDLARDDRDPDRAALVPLRRARAEGAGPNSGPSTRSRPVPSNRH